MLKNIEKVVYTPPSQTVSYSVQLEGPFARVQGTNGCTLVANLEAMEDSIQVRVNPFEVHESPLASVLVLFDFLFGHFPQLKQVQLVGLELPAQFESVSQLTRAQFYQSAYPWHQRGFTPAADLSQTETNGRQHPVRPTVENGALYRRYAPSIQKTISFRTVEIDRDLDLFHEWHNQPRVADLWELNKSKEELRNYLEVSNRDPHLTPLILEFDGVPAGYFEIYWATEDRLGPYYESDAYDRGFHFLIGNQAFLGKENTGEVVRSVMHLNFLEDSRTQAVVAEPRADNKRVLKYVQLVPGWRFIKEFDFPHKRAALVMAKRADFFGEGAL
jgi:acetyl CoA:N6-hydroxylysine acetyl transferase